MHIVHVVYVCILHSTGMYVYCVLVALRDRARLVLPVVYGCAHAHTPTRPPTHARTYLYLYNKVKGARDTHTFWHRSRSRGRRQFQPGTRTKYTCTM